MRDPIAPSNDSSTTSAANSRKRFGPVTLSPTTRTPSKIGRVLRTIFWALFFAFVFGFVVGTFLRRELDKPVRYIGQRSNAPSALTGNPRDVGYALTRIFMSGDHEEQVG